MWRLQGIPPEPREAASTDGASAWQTTRHIMLPLLGPTIRIWIFLSIIGSLQLFDLVWIMTLGGPANASSTMATYLLDHGSRCRSAWPRSRPSSPRAPRASWPTRPRR